MREKTLLKIAITCTIIGIFILYIISENMTLEEKNIFEAKQMQDEKVRIKGNIQKVIHKSGLTLITVVKNESIDVVVFDEVSYIEGDEIEIIGEVKQYNGKIEIVAEEIR